jgi:hypothetical protein
LVLSYRVLRLSTHFYCLSRVQLIGIAFLSGGLSATENPGPFHRGAPAVPCAPSRSLSRFYALLLPPPVVTRLRRAVRAQARPARTAQGRSSKPSGHGGESHLKPSRGSPGRNLGTVPAALQSQ